MPLFGPNKPLKRGRMTDESEESAARQRAGTAAAAGYPDGLGGTARASVPLSRSEWEAETGWHIRHHVHLGLRKGARADQLTARIVMPFMVLHLAEILIYPATPGFGF